MKLIPGILLLIAPIYTFAQKQPVTTDSVLLQPVEITAVRATEKNPIAQTLLKKDFIQKQNTGQDLPYILELTPSVIANSDAGNGIGYTGIRIRGTDASRINITLNGIPYNDAESQGSFFVDLPDIASSTSGIQIQRGVGTSTQGAGAFGGSINLNTNENNRTSSVELNQSGGTFNSFKHSLILHSGLIGKHFLLDGRISKIKSNGYIDRASSLLHSFYVSATYLKNKDQIKLNIFSGKETTYQAWYGIDSATLKTNRTFNAAGTEKPGTPYENENDHYTQTHYQLFYNRKMNENWRSGLAAFLTRGIGYYEQYKAAQTLSDYGLPNNGTITQTDLVRRLWLDNYFYGSLLTIQFNKNSHSIITGGGWNQYNGNHYGSIPWAMEPSVIPLNYRWYACDATKSEWNLYSKWSYSFHKNWQSFLDLQGRFVTYRINGFRDNPGIILKNNYSFFNPKFGITFTKSALKSYVSFSIAGKEPNRADFETGNLNKPRPERLYDLEAGASYRGKKAGIELNTYYMNYKDQLVLTGKINDVGAYTRTNISKSYRMGIECQMMYQPITWINLSGSITVSNNRIKEFIEFIDDYDNGGQVSIFHKNTPIALSPSISGFIQTSVTPIKKLTVTLTGKYVGQQFLDNTGNSNRRLRDYFVMDAKADYAITINRKFTLDLFIKGNNLFSRLYESNGYTFSYISTGQFNTANYYFPMAPIYFMAGINLRFASKP